MLGLDLIRAHFGDNWPNVARRAQDIIRTSIEGRLLPCDVYMQEGELSYTLVFPTLSADEAKVKCALMAREISRRLIGSDAVEKLFVIRMVQLAENGELLVSPEEGLRRLEEPAPSNRQAEDDGLKWVAINASAAVADARIAATTFVFRPIWNVGKKIIAAYQSIPASVGDDGHLYFGYAILPEKVHPAAFLKLDIATLNHAAATYAANEALRGRQVFGTSVHYETLANPQRRSQYLAACRQFDDAFCRYLMIEIVGVPAGAPNATLQGVANCLVPVCRSILLRLSFDLSLLNRLQGVMVYAVGVDVTGISSLDGPLIGLFNALNERAERVGVKTYAHGIVSLSLISAAICAGVEMVDSDVIASAAKHPLGLRRFDLVDLYGE